MKNNRGLSLIEVVVVLAIMAVVAGAGLSFMTLLTSNRVKECTNKISSTISKVRVDAMSKSKDSSGSDYYLELYKGADGKYYIRKHLDSTIVEEIVGGSNLTITYTENDLSASTYTISASEILTIKFDRTTGGFKPTHGTNYCKKIVVSNGSKSKTIVISPRTGKVAVE